MIYEYLSKLASSFCQTVHTKQQAIISDISALFASFNCIPSALAFVSASMPVKRFMTDSAITISRMSVDTLIQPSVIESPTSKILHNTPSNEWRLKDNYYHLWVNGVYTGIRITEITWIPVICFPHIIKLTKPIWRIITTLESPYLIDAPTIKEAIRIAECYYKLRLEVNSNGTVSYTLPACEVKKLVKEEEVLTNSQR